MIIKNQKRKGKLSTLRSQDALGAFSRIQGYSRVTDDVSVYNDADRRTDDDEIWIEDMLTI